MSGDTYYEHVPRGGPLRFPTWVVQSYVVTFLLFGGFAVTMIFQYTRWESYIFVEYVYVFLSLVSKTLLAWVVYLGIHRAPIIF